MYLSNMSLKVKTITIAALLYTCTCMKLKCISYMCNTSTCTLARYM